MAQHDGLNILLVPVDGRWVAHLLEHDLMGSGRVRVAAFESVLTAYRWCQENDALAEHGRARSELWAELSRARSLSLEELYRTEVPRAKHKARRASSGGRQPHDLLGVPPDLLATVSLPWMIHALQQHRHVRA